MNSFNKFFFLLVLFLFEINSFAAPIKDINISGNERISDETIIVFSSLKINDDLEPEDINDLLKRLYETNFFENIEISFKDQSLKIIVQEYPIIEKISYNGIKSKTLRNKVLKNLRLRDRSSYNKILAQEDRKQILELLGNEGYLFSTIDILKTELSDNRINLEYIINLNKKGKVKKITFLGEKIFKDKELRNVIVSEEYKFWKFISGRKYLNLNTVQIDERLLKNFYLNKGYYNVSINSSFARIFGNDEFEIIYNITPNNKFTFGDLKIEIPNDFDKKNFFQLESLLNDKNGEIYSILEINEILNEIDNISLEEQFESVSTLVEENIVNNQINLTFKIVETPKYYIQKINIFGNNVTNENVIRNQFEIDEGDPFNEILFNKSINNIKSLNFFKSVDSKIENDDQNLTKILNIYVEEKPTGEITAGAGFGTNGGTVVFGVKENNYLGNGIALDANLTLNAESIKGNFYVSNPNFNNSEKSVFFNLQSSETDRLTESGYKSNKTGVSIGTQYEYLNNTFLSLANSNYYEKITTDSRASSLQQKQQGDYWDSFLNIAIDYDKRNQKFRTSKGFRSIYGIDIPIISKTNTISSSYDYKYFTSLFDNTISTFSFSANIANSISDNIKLSERLYIPANKLRGFERGRVGPKDGNDFIGGNYMTSVNFSSNLPKILENVQNVDFVFFADVANVWGVDYNSSLDKSQKIKSSVGIGIDWYSIIGPLNFSIAQPITKSTNDVTETFRFNIGTSF